MCENAWLIDLVAWLIRVLFGTTFVVDGPNE